MSEFEQQVIETLAIISTRLGNVEDHLKTLNGRVVKQEAENFARQFELQRHASDCMTKADTEARLKPLETLAIQQAASSKTTKTLWEEFKPLVWVVAGAIGVILVKQSSLWLPVLGK
jgi:hypothetical protein